MNKHLRYCLILLGTTYFFFMFGNSILSLTNPDEVFYTLTAKEMVQQHTWTVPYLFGQPQFEKPILLYWFMRIAFLIFGITAFAARFIPAFFGMIGVLAVYAFGVLGFKNEKKAFICALTLASGGLYIGLARTVFTDMIFSVFIFLSLLAFFWGYTRIKHRNFSLILAFIASGLAVLSKGPLGFFIPFAIITAFLLIRKDIKYLFCKGTFFGFLLFLLTCLPWYIMMITKYGHSFTHEFFYNDHYRRLIEAEHAFNDTWYFYPMSIVGCFFPWSVFLLAALFLRFKNFKLEREKPIYLFSLSWIIITLCAFQFAHSKLVSYIFPLFAALGILSGDLIYDLALKENKAKLFKALSLITWSILAIIPFGLIFALFKFSDYLSSKTPAYALIVLFVLWLGLLLRFILKGRYFKAVYAFSCMVPIFFSIIPFVKNDMEPYLSSKVACEYLMKNYPVENTILTSKFFLRGTRFYTDHPIAAFSPYGKNYFSPHPILFLDTDEKTRDFLDKQRTTYFILNHNSVDDLERVGKAYNFKVTLLKVIGNEYLMSAEKIAAKVK
ncbi:MAG: glycosyltransferase family 39 protein [Candidatus Omnitrophica bacterium]|nr:glycosyltransferase family 39 protein [Candidatus Omnitrophota bacterium]MDD5653686.1 glycosyltransferase family 39 protein [Candidatus Omnitrophota bacterium]